MCGLNCLAGCARRSCKRPSLPIRRGRAGAGLLAHVMVAKYCDHLPLHRQAEIYAREDIDLSRSTLADMVGQTARLVRPLVDALAKHVMAGHRVHADDTVVPVPSPGLGRTRTARLWTYVRDHRPFGGADPPAALYRYSPDRRGEHPRAHLSDFRGILQADGCAGYAELYADGRVVEAACMAHARRKFFDVHETTKSAPAREALDRIGAPLPDRARHPRPSTRAAPAGQDRAQRAADGRVARLARRNAQPDLRAQRHGGRHPLRPVARGRADADPAPRPRLHRQLGRRARHALGRRRQTQLDVRRVGHVSAAPFDATVERLIADIAQAGLTLFGRIDHQAGSRDAELDMPPATVLTFGHAKGGTPVMVATPLAALDLPPHVLIRLRDDGTTAIAFHPISAPCRAAWATRELGSGLPLSGVLVGSQLSARGGEHRCPAVRCSSARACHGCNSNRLADLGHAGYRDAARSNGAGLFKGQLRSLSA